MSNPAAPPLILLGVTASIAAYRAAELARLLVRDGLQVQSVLTADAERFVGADLFSSLTRRPALTDAAQADGSYPHLDASRQAAVVCIAPCSANTLAKLALGLADNVLTQSALAASGPLVLAPAMNLRMWHHPATRANVEILRGRGATIVGPAEGELAEGEWGMGRMSEPPEIRSVIQALLRRPTNGPLAGRRVLVTAGGTREPIDGVRFLGNRSSGRMGAALADEAAARGARVTTLLANARVRPAGGEIVDVETTRDLERETLARAVEADVVLLAAAVADYRPASPVEGKRPRGGSWTLQLEPTADIAAAVGAARRPHQILVGFAAEMGADAVGRAREKLARKRLDLVVLNDVSRTDIGFDAADNEVALVFADSVEPLPKGAKTAVAAAILDRVEGLLG